MNNEKIVIPGEKLGTEEEYLSGKNTFEDDGKIRASNFGKAIFDDNEKEIKIEGKKIECLKRNDVVYAKIILVKESMAIVELIKEENNHSITTTKGQIAVRNISNNYVENPYEYFKIGDIVKAKILEISDNVVELTTKEEGLGVVIAYCTNCRKEMVYSNEKLTCFECNRSEKRKWYEQKEERNNQRFESKGRFNNVNNRNFNRGVNSYGNRSYNK
jgi:exosome complex component CSL4